MPSSSSTVSAPHQCPPSTALTKPSYPAPPRQTSAEEEDIDNYSESSDLSQDPPVAPRFLVFWPWDDSAAPQVDRLHFPAPATPWDQHSLEPLHTAAWSGMLGALALLSNTVDHSTSDHAMLHSIIRAAHLQGAHVFFWFPQPCHADTETAHVHLCQELATHCVWLAPPNAKPLLLCTTDDAASTLPSAEDPWSQLLHIIAKNCTSTLKMPASIDRIAKYMPGHFLPRRPAVCDGAGLFSTADHTASNVSTKPKPLKAIASTFLTYLKSHGLVSRIKSQLESEDSTAPLSEEQGLVSSRNHSPTPSTAIRPRHIPRNCAWPTFQTECPAMLGIGTARQGRRTA